MSKGALGLLSAYWPERTARHAHIPLERVSQFCVHRPAASDPDRPALITPARAVTFAELSAMVGAAAGHIAGRVGEGGRVAVVAEDPVELAAVALGCLEADRLAFLSSAPVETRALDAFSPDLVVGAGGVDAAGLLLAARGVPEVSGEAPSPGRPNLRLPVLALPRPWPGEVLHNHKTLVATAVSF